MVSRKSPWERARGGTNEDHRMRMRWVGPPQDERGREQVSCRVGELVLKRPGGGVHVEHSKAGRHGPLPPGLLRLGS